MSKRVVTEYTVQSSRIKRARTVAIVSDLHDRPFEDIPEACESADMLLVPGDLVHRYPKSAARGLELLRLMARRMPVYYCYGNHEDECDGAYAGQVRRTGAVLLNNAYCRDAGLVIGGMYVFDKPRRFHPHDRQRPGDLNLPAATRMLRQMQREDGFRLVISHKPEHFARYIRAYDIDLTVSGHAHGGQIRVLGQGLYAPHQGLLPPITKGFYENHRLLVSVGAGNPKIIPRLGNPCEIVLLRLAPSEQANF